MRMAVVMVMPSRMTAVAHLLDLHAGFIDGESELYRCDRRGDGGRRGKSGKTKAGSSRERDQSLLHRTISCATAEWAADDPTVADAR
jgi:hypothetical protein